MVGDQVSVNEQDVLGLVDNVDGDRSQQSGHLPALLQGIQGRELGAAGQNASPVS